MNATEYALAVRDIVRGIVTVVGDGPVEEMLYALADAARAAGDEQLADAIDAETARVMYDAE